jgi:hypothetical protein
MSIAKIKDTIKSKTNKKYKWLLSENSNENDIKNKIGIQAKILYNNITSISISNSENKTTIDLINKTQNITGKNSECVNLIVNFLFTITTILSSYTNLYLYDNLFYHN